MNLRRRAAGIAGAPPPQQDGKTSKTKVALTSAGMGGPPPRLGPVWSGDLLNGLEILRSAHSCRLDSTQRLHASASGPSVRLLLSKVIAAHQLLRIWSGGEEFETLKGVMETRSI